MFNPHVPVAWGLEYSQEYSLRRVVRSDYLRDMSYPLPPIHCIQGLLACNGRMSWDSWALGCPGSGNILFLRGMSSYFSEPTASVSGDPELQT